MSVTDSNAFQIRYWGATGSIASPLSPADVTSKFVAALMELGNCGALEHVAAASADPAALQALLERHLPFHLRSTYGGNTTCVEIGCGGETLIVDAGSGIRLLGFELAHRWDTRPDLQRHAHLLLTHPHGDHTLAIPFVDALYDARNHFELWATQHVLDSLDVLLNSLSVMQGIYFPPSYEMMPAVKTFHAIEPSAEFAIGTTRIRTIPLNHPGGCIGYRFECDGRVFVFASDHEHSAAPDAQLAEFARGADLLYLDAQYLAEEYHGRKGIGTEAPLPREGWGHSTVEACVRTAVAAGVKRLHLGHLDPHRGDAGRHQVELLAHELLRDELKRAGCDLNSCRVQLVYEGLQVDLTNADA